MLPFAPETYAVSDLCGEIKDFLGTTYGSLWVVGEVQRVRTSQRGHLYFELVEKGSRDEIVAKLDCVIWSSNHTRIRKVLSASGQEIAEGLQIRCRGGIDFYPPGGRLQLVIREVDPVFTLGLLAKRRQETLAALTKAGLLDLNKSLDLPAVPIDIALITSEGSAAYHDFLSTLNESGLGFRVLFVHSSVQGQNAERELVSAFKAIHSASPGSGGVDCVVLIRGGGARSDLAVFDSRAVAEAVARCRVPVLTGLGHQIDEAISDLVAHTALKTPTKAAELLIERILEQERRVELLRESLVSLGLERLRRVRERVVRAERDIERVKTRLQSAAIRVAALAASLGRVGRLRIKAGLSGTSSIASRLALLAPRLVRRNEPAVESRARRLVAASESRVREASTRLAGLERLTRQLGPERILERGFSITRDAAGAVIRTADEVSPGDLISTQLAGGSLVSQLTQRSIAAGDEAPEEETDS